MSKYEYGGIEGVSFESEGMFLIGTIYIGSGEGKMPTVVLLHGLPGFEKNVDIAYGLREMGWNTFIPHYRGCWGSEGRYRFTGIPTDVKNAITTITTRPYVDKENIFLVGHSLGAWAAIVTTAQENRVRGTIAIAGATTQQEASERAQTHLRNIIEHKFLKGITYDQALVDWKKRGRDLAAQDFIAQIAPRPLLLISGADDTTATPRQVKALFNHAEEPKDLVIMEGADHVFTRKRRELVTEVTDWLLLEYSSTH